jgi:AraC-like DNA-binding protein
LSVAEVSWLVGYSEPSAFHRAFKRWRGVSPRSFREDRRHAPPT